MKGGHQLIPRHRIHLAKELRNPLDIRLDKRGFEQSGNIGFQMLDVAGAC